MDSDTWELWKRLPEPKRLHCEKGICHVIVSDPTGGYSVGPDTDMDDTIHTDALTEEQAICMATDEVRKLQCPRCYGSGYRTLFASFVPLDCKKETCDVCGGTGWKQSEE